MKKAQIIEFEVGIFRENILVCISASTDKLKEAFPKEDFASFEKTHLGLAFGAVHKDNKYRRVIWLKKWDIPTLVHEAYHLTSQILDHTGVEDNETGAFLMEFIYTETIKKVKAIK